jgi:hypothetical protein
VVLVDRVVCRIESAAVAASEREREREPAARLAEFQRSFIDKLRRLIEEGIDAGAFHPVNATLAAKLLDASANRIQDPRALRETGPCWSVTKFDDIVLVE